MSEPTAYADAGGASSLSPAEIWRVVVQRIWSIASIFVVVSAVGIWIVAQMPSEYESTATLLVDAERPRILGVDPVLEQGEAGAAMSARDFLALQEHVATSLEMRGRIVESLGLARNLRFLGLEDIEDPEELEAAIESANPRERLRSMLSVQALPERRMIRIVIGSRHPEIAAQIANELAQTLVDRNMERQLESTDAALEWLTDQRDQLRTALQRVEMAQIEYLREQNTLSVSLSDRQNLNVAAIEVLNSQLAGARLEADRVGSLVRHIDSLRSSDELLEAGIEPIITNGLIQGLKGQLIEIEQQEIELASRYGEEWIDLRVLRERRELISRVLDREILNVLQSFQQEYDTARALTRTLESRLAAAQQVALRSGENEMSFNALQRESESNRELYSVIERRLKELELSRMLNHNALSVLEPAVTPTRPVRPKREQLIAIVLFGALLLGLFIALASHFLDTTVRTQGQLEREFGLPFLGLIPIIKPRKAKKRSDRGPGRGEEFSKDTYVHTYPRSDVSESYRSIRTNLLFMDSEEPLKRILVTSSGPREGKTLTCTNMATVLAQGGERTLLIDADLRRPRLHRVFGLPMGQGITNVILGECSLDEAIQPTDIDGLFVLPSGPIPPNPSELLQGRHFRDLVNRAAESFDRVLVDTPPIAPVTDAVILASELDGVIVVVNAGRTRREILARAVDSLDGVKANILGAVLNGVDVTSRRAAGEYYYYYYRQHGQYYGEIEATSTSD